MPEKKGRIRQIGSTGNLLSLGFTGGVCVALALFFGHQIDLYFFCEPWGKFGGIITGIAAAAIQTWKQLNSSMKEFARSNERHKEPTEKE